ncbi:MAG: VWA-like domain-containing protein [Lachnospiraceae bacterium]|nr:VWA-like domain-containing protein [Lachnospiraceae bacterium]
MIPFKAKAEQAAPMILGFLQEKAIASDPEHAGAYDLSHFKEASCKVVLAHDSDHALWEDNDGFFYCTEALALCFTENSNALQERFHQLCQEAFLRKYGVNSSKTGLCSFGAGAGACRGKDAGTDSSDATLSCRDRTDYRRLLRRFCVPREEMFADLDSFDYIPYMYGQNMSSKLCLVDPLEYSEVNRLDELAIAIDTSGSCSGELVTRFLEETWSILRQRENFFSRMRLHLIQCDSMIQEYRLFTSVEEWESSLGTLKIQGNGNTDFRPVFELLEDRIAKKEIRKLRALLYFTDGDGIYPQKAPAYETAFVFVNQNSVKGKVPAWAQQIILD